MHGVGRLSSRGKNAWKGAERKMSATDLLRGGGLKKKMKYLGTAARLGWGDRGRDGRDWG